MLYKQEKLRTECKETMEDKIVGTEFSTGMKRKKYLRQLKHLKCFKIENFREYKAF